MSRTCLCNLGMADNVVSAFFWHLPITTTRSYRRLRRLPRASLSGFQAGSIRSEEAVGRFPYGLWVVDPPRNTCISEDTEEKQAFDSILTVEPGEFNNFVLETIAHIDIRGPLGVPQGHKHIVFLSISFVLRCKSTKFGKRQSCLRCYT